MNTTPAQSQPNRTPPHPVKVRVMRGFVGLVAVIFLLISFVAFWVLRSGVEEDAAFMQQLVLNEGQTQLENILNSQRTTLSQIAASTAMREFALQSVSTTTQDQEVLQTSQSGLISQLDELMRYERGDLILARYIMRTGSVWTELQWENGQVIINDDFTLSALDSTTAPQLQVAQNTEAGEVAIADFQIEQNPDGSLLPVMTLITPITRPNDLNSLLGVLEIKINAAPLLTSLQTLTNRTDSAFQDRLLIVDQTGRILADSDEIGLNYLQEAAITNEDITILETLQENPGSIENISISRFPEIREISATSLADVTGTGVDWRLVTVTSAQGELIDVFRSTVILLLINAIAVGVIVYYMNRSLQRNLLPLNFAGNIIRQLVNDTPTEQQESVSAIKHQTPAQIPEVAKPADDDYKVYQAAQELANRLQELNKQIDNQTERYNRNLKVAARISRETALLENIDDLLNRSIDLIAISFNIYHAQVFLVDEAGVNAVLRYSYGEAGKRLLAQGHMLQVGSQSVIGRVTSSGQPVIVNDVKQGQQGGTHAFNPILSATRSEMALPLQIGDQILGALDLQSTYRDAFQEEDQQTYQLIADQIAIAIYKTRLLRESEDRIDTIEKLNRQLTQMAWAELEREIGLDQAYRYNLLEVEPGSLDDTQEITRTAELMAIPIKIRNEVIGTMHAAPPQGMAFTDGDYSILSSVAERVALAVENARLFQETQSNLAETSTLYDTTRALNEATTLRDIIEAIITAAIQDAIGGQIAIFDDYLTGTPPETVQIIASWIRPDYTGRQIHSSELIEQRFRIEEHHILQELNESQITLVQDTERDIRMSEELRKLYNNMGSRAIAYIPLTVRGNWRGFAQITFPQPRDFSEREGRIYGNLIDQAGVAIDNRLLLQQTEDALSQNERLYAGSRMINQAIDLESLVRAAVVTSDLPDLNFGLALFQGDIDRSGWSRRIHHVAQSQDGIIRDPNRTYDIIIDDTSPMRERSPEIVNQENAADSPMQQTIMQIFATNGDTYGTVFPLFSANQPIALFFASRQQEIPLSDEDLEIYRALTGMMSTVIQNRNLLDQMGEALDETRRLYDASRAITDAQDLEAMYHASTQHMTDNNGNISRINIFLAGPEPSADAPFLDVAYSWVSEDCEAESLPAYTRLMSNQAPFGQLTNERGTGLFYARDMENDLRDYPALARFFAESKAQNVLITSLNPRQQWLGVMTLESQKHNAFDDSYQRFVDALGDQIAIALENQMLFQEAQQQARQALALAEASSLANQIGIGLTDAIDTMFQRVSETAGYDRWLLMLLEGNELHPVTQHSPNPEIPMITGRLNLSTAEHTLADAVRFDRTMVINDPASESAYRDRPAIQNIVGKHIATPIITGETVIGALMVGRALTEPDMADRDEILISTMATQVAVSVENQRLFDRAENERGTLSSILETLPAGVLVLDAETLLPIQYNQPVEEYLGRTVDTETPFSASLYSIYRTGTNLHYPDTEIPTVVTMQTGEPALADDLSVITAEGHVSDLLMNAAPIRNSAGEIINIVVALEDISNLRGLENTLQDNLRETIALYEATRALTSAEELNDVLDVVTFQLGMLEPTNAHLILRDQTTTEIQVARSLLDPIEAEKLPPGILPTDMIVVSNNVAYDDLLTEPDRQQLILLGIQAFASMPLAASNRAAPLGWLIVTHDMPHNFAPEDERFLSTLGDNAAVAVDNRYLFERTEAALLETNRLYNATRSISSAKNMDDLSGVLRQVLEALKPDAYAAYLMIDPSSPDDITELFNIYQDGAPFAFQSLLTTYGLFRDENIYLEDIHNLPDPTPFEQAIREFGAIQSFASVSLRMKDMPDGRVFLAYNHAKTFTESDTRYLKAISDSASVVVDNILLLGQIQQALEETSTLYQSSRALADATTPHRHHGCCGEVAHRLSC